MDKTARDRLVRRVAAALWVLGVCFTGALVWLIFVSWARADPPCAAPHCAPLEAGAPAPWPGYLYSGDAHERVGEVIDQLVAAGRAAEATFTKRLNACDARAQQAEQDRAAADAALRRCSMDTRHSPGAPVEGTGRPPGAAPGERVAWVAVTFIATVGAAAAADAAAARWDWGATASTVARYGAATAGGATMGLIAWRW